MTKIGNQNNNLLSLKELDELLKKLEKAPKSTQICPECLTGSIEITRIGPDLFILTKCYCCGFPLGDNEELENL